MPLLETAPGVGEVETGDSADEAEFVVHGSSLSLFRVTVNSFLTGYQLRGNVTIVSPTKISVDEAYKVFSSVLEVQGFTTVQAGSIIKIVPSADARSKSVETGFE